MMLIETIQVTDNKFDILYATTDIDLLDIKKLDDQIFGNYHGITVKELEKIFKYGLIIMMQHHDTQELIGHTDILFKSIDELPYQFSFPTGYCYGTGILQKYQGRGLGRQLAYYQELEAITRNYKELLMTIRVENYYSLRLRLGMGYLIFGYNPIFYGKNRITDARLFLKKSIVDNTKIFPERQPISDDFVLVSVDFDNVPNLEIHDKISELCNNGYIGIAIDKNGIYFKKQ